MAGFAIWSLRLQVAPACTPRIRENAPGVVCIGMQGNDDAPPLIVVWDEDPEGLNEGASATNGMAEILRHLHKCWSTRFDVERAVVVQRDSDGAFDFVLPEWPSIPTATGLARVHWRPLRFPPGAPRTFEAFRWMYGTRAEAALASVRAIQSRPSSFAAT